MAYHDRKSAKEINEGRFLRRLAYRTSDEDCWIWGSTTLKRKRADGSIYQIPIMPLRLENGAETIAYARRFAWEMKFGSIYPPNSHLVNICGEELCVKPDEKHNRPTNPGDVFVERQQAGVISHRPGPRPVPKDDEEFLKGK